MIETLLQAGASNAIVAAALAGLAWTVHRSGRWPALAHGLWVLVLLRLVVPPVLTLPLVSMPGIAPPVPETEPAASVRRASEAAEAAAGPSASAVRPAADAAPPSGLAAAPRRELAESAAGRPSGRWSETTKAAPVATAGSPDRTPGSLPWAALAVGVWAAGSLAVLGVTMVRAVRFHRRLLASAAPAAEPVRRLTEELAVRFGMRQTPQVLVCPGRLGPLVWWVGGPVRIVVPAALADPRDASGHARLRWILAHELAHVRRRDHLVRWIECAACTVGWWNPVAWWARGRLRLDEEACCDALVLRTLEPRPREYAGSLLSAVQLLASAPPDPRLDAPTLASGLDAGGALERRITMISRNRPSPGRRMPRRLLLAATALAVLPLGLVHSQDMESVGERLRAAVSAGELSEQQAGAMMERLREFADREQDRPAREAEWTHDEAWDHRPRFAALFDRAQAAGARRELESDELETVMRELKLMLQRERIADNLQHGTLSTERADEMFREVEAGLEAVRTERRSASERFVSRTEAAARRGELSRDRARDMIREAEARADRMHELVHGDPGVTHGRERAARMRGLVHGDLHAEGSPDRVVEHEPHVDDRAEDWTRELEHRLEPSVDRLRAAVERGEIETRLAELRLGQERERVMADLRREATERLERRSRELLHAVEAGRLSVDEAMERLRAAYDARREAEVALR